VRPRIDEDEEDGYIGENGYLSSRQCESAIRHENVDGAVAIV